MKKLADIYINIPVKSIAKAYTYIIPEKFDILKEGCRVLVPFGNRIMEGFIIKIYANNEHNIDITKLKEIKDIIDTEAWFTPQMYTTAKWMADFYLCSLGETMRLFILEKIVYKFALFLILTNKNMIYSLKINYQQLKYLCLNIFLYKKILIY